MRFSPSCCCGCEVFTDDFDRADDSSLGADWTETGWSIASNQAVTSTSDDLALLNAASFYNGSVAADFIGQDYGDEFRIYLRYTDANNHIYAEYKLAPSMGTQPTMEIWEVIAGTPTQKGSTAYFTSGTGEPGIQFSLRFCVAENVAIASRTNLQEGIDEYGSGTASLAMDTTTLTGEGIAIGSGTITSSIAVTLINTVTYGADCPFCRLCLVFADDFDRADDTDPGSDWTEITGDWEIAGNELALIGGDPYDYIERNVGSLSGRQEALFKGTASGQEFGFISKRVADTPEDQYYGALLKLGSSGSGTVRTFYKDDTGAFTYGDATPVTAAPNVWHRFELCNTGSVAVISLNGEIIASWAVGLIGANVGGIWSHTGGTFYVDEYRETTIGQLCECDRCLKQTDGVTNPATWSDNFAYKSTLWLPWSIPDTDPDNDWDWDGGTLTAKHEMDYVDGSGASSTGALYRCLSASPLNLRTLGIGATWSVQCKFVSRTAPASPGVGDPYFVFWRGGCYADNGSTRFIWGPAEYSSFADETVRYRLSLDAPGFPVTLQDFPSLIPTPGDVLKMVIIRTSSTEVSVECWLNGVLEHTETGVTWTAGFAGFLVANLGMWNVSQILFPSGNGTITTNWDDFTCTVTKP